MPHAVNIEVSGSQKNTRPRPKNRSLPHEMLQNTSQLLELRELYAQSQSARVVDQPLHTISEDGQPITRIVSLGLSSLFVTKGQSRRLKQLAILLTIQDQFQERQREPIEVYAQDPTFSRQDEASLTSSGIRITRTSSGSDLGEAASVISPITLVYSPFLTPEAYQQLLLRPPRPVQYLICEHFDALLQKWPDRSAEWKQVEDVVKRSLTSYKRKAVSGDGLWFPEDETIPMAMCSRSDRDISLKIKSKV